MSKLIISLLTALLLCGLFHGWAFSKDKAGELQVISPAFQHGGKIPKKYPEKGYLTKIPKDPWGNDYIYISPGEHDDFDLISYGADSEEGGEGKNADVRSWEIE